MNKKGNLKIKSIAILVLPPLIGASAAWEFNLFSGNVFEGFLIGSVLGLAGYFVYKRIL